MHIDIPADVMPVVLVIAGLYAVACIVQFTATVLQLRNEGKKKKCH